MPRILILLPMILALAACGGGGGGGTDNGNPPPQTFSVTGTISGLTSDGLTLSFNGSSVPVARGATTVALGSSLSSGTTYTVSVQTQPTGLPCAVTNGSGTITSANVANVVVTCSAEAFALGGTVAGLDRSGLVLANGSDTLQVDLGASTFTMPTKVAFTSSYTVTVQTQPTGLACEVASGTGTMPAQAVTDVKINCSVKTYTLGGTISGLTASGLVLLNNGGDATPIAANTGPFTMLSPVAHGSSFAITVQTQPAGETCTVTQDSGVATAVVESIVITCAPWSTFTLSTLHSFGAIGDGAQPLSRLIQARDGNFYGTTPFGGANNRGTVFQITPAGVEIVVHSFGTGADDGQTPLAGLIQARDGNFYGTTNEGGANGVGTVFRIAPTGGVTVLYSFGASTVDGSSPESALVQASDDNFYGTTSGGGANGMGTVFRIALDGTQTVLHSFGASGDDGQHPVAALIQARDGDFYGTTDSGGANGVGTVFQITPEGVETVLHSFGASGDGATPVAALIQASDGNFYGTTDSGGVNDSGTVFRIAPTGAVTVLHSFGSSSDGAYPESELIEASDGNFYGTTQEGSGTNSVGMVFRITPAGVETVVHSFIESDEGRTTYAGLIQASDGNFYGATRGGGEHDRGTVFKIVPR